MQYLLAVLDTETGTGTPEEMSAIDAFNDRLRADGRLIFLGGLASPASSTLVDQRTGAATAQDGESPGATAYMSGLWIIEARDFGEALELAGEASAACNRRVELRQFLQV